MAVSYILSVCVCSSNMRQTVRLADTPSCQSEYPPFDGQVHLADYRTRASFYFQPVVRASPSELAQLQHCVFTPHPPLRPPSRPLYHRDYASSLHPETRYPHQNPHSLPANPLETHPIPHRNPLRRRRLLLGKSLPLPHHPLPRHPPHQTLLPQRRPGWPPFRLPRQQPQHIPLLLPCSH